MKKIWFWLVPVLLLLTACGGRAATDTPTKHTNTATSEETIKKSAVPTLFIHGYSGTANSFGGMIRRLSIAGAVDKGLVVTVAPNGELTVEGSLKGKQNPTIQVLFEDNKNNEWNQSQWIKNVMVYLKEQGVTETNLVGHSMGGVSSLRYLLTYGNETDVPKVAKFIAIAAPFNGFPGYDSGGGYDQPVEDLLKKGPIATTDRYNDYASMIGGLNKEMPILLIAGQQSDTDLSDGTVPVVSALAVDHLLTTNGNPVQYQIITKRAQHSQLHENTQVDGLVIDFLWK